MNIKSFVFIDFETTGLPCTETRTKITEIAMVACSAQHILETRKGSLPRVLHKLVVCLNPMKMIQLGASEITGDFDHSFFCLRLLIITFRNVGLYNDLLEHEKPFQANTTQLLNHFLQQLQSPVCLVAHNGLNFDFPLLQKQLGLLVTAHYSHSLCTEIYLLFSLERNLGPWLTVRRLIGHIQTKWSAASVTWIGLWGVPNQKSERSSIWKWENSFE